MLLGLLCTVLCLLHVQLLQYWFAWTVSSTSLSLHFDHTFMLLINNCSVCSQLLGLSYICNILLPWRHSLAVHLWCEKKL